MRAGFALMTWTIVLIKRQLELPDMKTHPLLQVATNDTIPEKIIVPSISLNPFYANVPSLNPLEMSENLRLSEVFRGFKYGILAWNWVKWK